MHWLLLLAFSTSSYSREIPEFDDELLGRLIISTKKFPFLTPKHSPELAHVYPTDQQLDRIKKTVGSEEFAVRAKRAANGTGDELPSDPTAAFAWFTEFKQFLGQFLKFEFSYEILNSAVVDPGSLPFDKISSDAFFKAMVIEKDRLQSYLEQEFNPRMRSIAASEKP
ncbi:hypothetical protein PRIPAC_88655 [Pristionchus pacificus]|uniref:Uncharacterized protein n=1 Tax=Pristionchus pacificus TaxID=54126 RepID=A0A2A6CTW1_PRIPA|nr:hypothetical protein PRIPAC_88655 [Pristionchus pacificus]|eukprot:PDM81487.1 hypothetical protein PRIPAC_35363 [Pristionchus pacificus]